MIGIYILAGICASIGIVLVVINKKAKCKDNRDVKTDDTLNYDKETDSLTNMAEDKVTNKQIQMEQGSTEKIQLQSTEKVNDEMAYLEGNGFIKNGTRLPHIIVKYYNGHPIIDLKGITEEKKFYMWFEEDNFYLLDINFINSSGIIELPRDSIIYFKKIQGKITMVNFRYREETRYVFLDENAYLILKTNIPDKEKK